MACTIEHRRFYCTTAHVSFGPEFESDDQGEQFRMWMYQNHGDPRKFDSEFLYHFFVQWKASQK